MITEFRRWLAFGTGVAIEVRNEELHLTVVRVRPSQIGILGAATVTEYKTRPAGEWGGELLQFLRKLGFAHIAATILLPRQDVIVRQISLPGVSEADTEGAIALQIDGLHPFGEEDVYYSWGRLGKSHDVLIGIARREVVDRYITLLAEAGVKVKAFTFSAAVLYSVQRLAGSGPRGGFLAVRSNADETELYGESEARPVFSAVLPPEEERAIASALSELRLQQDAEVLRVENLLPRPSIFPQSYDPDGPEYGVNALGFATAIVSACPWLGIDANMLPEEQRRGSSRVRLIPTFVLGAILLLLVGALAAQSRYEDRRYLNLLQGEVRKLEPQSRKVDSMDKQIAAARSRTQLLDEFRRRTKLDIDALSEITKIIAPPGWVNGLELDRTTIQFGGEAEQAATLLKLLDNSQYFAQSQFTMPISKQGVGEAFRVKAARETPVAGSAK